LREKRPANASLFDMSGNAVQALCGLLLIRGIDTYADSSQKQLYGALESWSGGSEKGGQNEAAF